MSEQEAGGFDGRALGVLEEMRGANSEAFSIIGTEMAEMKAMLSVLLDLQKSVIMTTGMSEADVEAHVRTLTDAYRERFLSALSGRIKTAADAD
ncbi:MAG TPA: hypothetical protein VFX96_16340 [Pyrinomonadaceae bacterium]|nr:hypothetical protein [Pyrinomonadaceae bacterium]